MSEAVINEEFIVENYNRMTVTELAKYFNVTRGTICRRAKKLGLEKEKSFDVSKGEQLTMLKSPLDRYGITPDGKVVNTLTNRILKHKTPRGAYPVMTFQIDGKKYYRRLHRLLAECFIPNPYQRPDVNHIDGNKENYALSNLEWVTPKENAIHASEIGLLSKGETSGTNSITEEQARMILLEIKSGGRTCDIERKYTFATRSIIQKIKYGKSWKHLQL